MTLVYQSYRTQNVPQWITNCLDSVQKWAEQRGYHYEFIDDRLFEFAPQWYRDKVKDNVQLVSDLSRLILARDFLRKGYERVIWMDADLLIFEPDNFDLETEKGAYFCREIWIDEDKNRNVVYQEKINNSVSVYHQGNSLLEFYIDACLKLVENTNTTPPVLVGTSFLTDLNRIYPLELIRNVGIISPALVHDLLHNSSDFIEKYLHRHDSNIYAANLCGSMKNEFFRKTEITDATMDEVVAKLLSGNLSRGQKSM